MCLLRERSTSLVPIFNYHFLPPHRFLLCSPPSHLSSFPHLSFLYPGSQISTVLLNSIEPSISKVSSLLPLASLIYFLYTNQAKCWFISHLSCPRIINFYQLSWLKLFARHSNCTHSILCLCYSLGGSHLPVYKEAYHLFQNFWGTSCCCYFYFHIVYSL